MPDDSATVDVVREPPPAATIEDAPPHATDRLIPLKASGRFVTVPYRPADRRRLAIGIVTSLIGLYFLWQVQEVLPPFVIAIALAALLDPTIRHLQRKGRSRIYAILILYVFGLCVIGLIGLYVVPAISAQVEEISHHTTDYYNNFQHTADHFLHKNAKLLGMLGIHQQRISDLVNQKSGPFTAQISALLGGVTGFVSNAASKAIWLVIIPIATFFLMRDYPIIRARLLTLLPEEQQHSADVMSREIVDVFITYIRGLVKICFLYGITAYVVFTILGIEYALFLGILAGLFYSVPYIGPVLTALVSGAVAYSMGPHGVAFGAIQVSGTSLGYAFACIAILIAVNQLFDNIVFPRIVGESIGLHPVVSIFALMAGATLFSVWGMLLAMPVAASIQIILMYFFPKMSQPIKPSLLDAENRQDSARDINTVET